MNTAVLAALAISWGVALSLLVLLLIRQVSLISVRLNLQMNMPDASDVGTGPELGSPVPPSLHTLVPHTGSLVALTGACASCHSFVERLPSAPISELSELRVLVPSKGQATRDLVDKMPAWVVTIRDPEASDIGKELGLSRTRRALRIHEGVVVGSAEVESHEDLVALIRHDLPHELIAANARDN